MSKMNGPKVTSPLSKNVELLLEPHTCICPECPYMYHDDDDLLDHFVGSHTDPDQPGGHRHGGSRQGGGGGSAVEDDKAAPPVINSSPRADWETVSFPDVKYSNSFTIARLTPDVVLTDADHCKFMPPECQLSDIEHSIKDMSDPIIVKLDYGNFTVN